MSVEDGDLAGAYFFMQSVNSVLSTAGNRQPPILSYVYSFLTERSHFTVAETVKKAAKDVAIIKGHQDGPTLPVIVKQWKQFTTERGKEAFPCALGLITSTTLNLTASPSRIKSTRSTRSGSDADSDCTILVQHVTC